MTCKKVLFSFLALSVLFFTACTQPTDPATPPATPPVTPPSPPSKIAVTSVSLNNATLNVGLNQGGQLSASVLPANASDTSIAWSSSDEGVASVKEGLISGLKEGKATITATTTDGAKKATCTVTVIARVPVTVVTMNTKTLSFSSADTKTLTVTIAPTEATDKRVIWSSSNTAIATVNSSTGDMHRFTFFC